MNFTFFKYLPTQILSVEINQMVTQLRNTVYEGILTNLQNKSRQTFCI